MRIAIIGGGASGLAAARVLRAFGHDLVLHEKAPDLGGVWSATRRYPGISTQDDRATYAFSDFPMPTTFAEHPSGAQVRAYFEQYATEHGLGGAIRLGSEVTEVSRTAGGWRVRSQGPDGESVETADFVVIANGVFSASHIPDWPGRAGFEAAGGAITVPSDLGDGDGLRGRDVVVIGWGKTACDVAAASAAIARSTAVVVRAVRWKHPKRIGRHLTFRHLLMTRLGEHMLAPNHTSLAGRVLARADRPLRQALDRYLADRVSRQLGLDAISLRPAGPYSDSSALVSEGFYEAVADGALQVHREQTVVALGGDADGPFVRLSGGARVPADVLIPGTGYDQRLEPLSVAVQQDLLGETDELRLHRAILPVGVPDLAFIGWSHTFHSPLRSELQAMWLADHLARGTTPSGDVSVYHLTHARAARLGVQQLPSSTFGDLDLLLEDMGVPVSLSLRTRQLIRPIDPADYAWVLDRLLRREQQRTRDPEIRQPAEAAFPG